MEQSNAPTPEVPQELKTLVKELAQLKPAVRTLVIDAAQKVANDQREPLPTVPWDLVWKLRGIVKFGGNAVEDCNALYGALPR